LVVLQHLSCPRETPGMPVAATEVSTLLCISVHTDPPVPPPPNRDPEPPHPPVPPDTPYPGRPIDDPPPAPPDRPADPPPPIVAAR
jgi:hypothetical protein